MLCEGEMTDGPVLNQLLEHQFPHVSFNIRGVSKRVIFEAADIELAKLYHAGAERLIVVWDLLPVGDRMGVTSQVSSTPNRREQRQTLLRLLCESPLLPANIRSQAQSLAGKYGFIETNEEQYVDGDDLLKLVCVCYTLDGWLLSDGSVLRQMASSEMREADRWNPPHPDRCKQPARELGAYFSKGHNKRLRAFNKALHNALIAEEYIRRDRVGRMSKSASFSRLVETVEAWSV